jgi:hypothetical protein
MSDRETQTVDEPMNDPQRSRLGTLAEEAGIEVPAHLTKSEASKLIGELERSDI